MQMTDRIIVALDTDVIFKAEKMVRTLGPLVSTYKVGLRLFTKSGVNLLTMLKRYKKNIFLDLKFHDIPNTVAGAAESATELGVWAFNVHASGGIDMMRAARDAALRKAKELKIVPPKVLGVTVLTSMNEEALTEAGVGRNIKEQVVYLAKLAQKSGLDGVVASPKEIGDIRKSCGRNFLIVTPGIRPEKVKGERLKAEDKKDDQKRVMTARDAIAAGADYIVVGRPVIEAKDPVETVKKIMLNVEL